MLDLNDVLVSKDAAKRYPDFELLTKLGIDSYFGAPLISPNGEIIGLISVMDNKILDPDTNLRPILNIFANRIALELQRKSEEKELQGMANQLSYQASHDALTGLFNRDIFDGFNLSIFHWNLCFRMKACRLDFKDPVINR